MFEKHCTDVVQRLRSSLIDLYRSIGADPAASREVSRQFKLNKNLTWKIAKIINAVEPLEAVQHIPGAGGMQLFLKALTEGGAPAESIARVTEAMAAFDKMIEIHTGDRATLDLVLDSMAGLGSDRLEMSRKLAFRGNSGVFGVQTRVRSVAHFLAPSADDPEMLDLAAVGGVVDFRCLRPISNWPLFRLRRFTDDGATIEPHMQAIEPSSSATPLLLEEFCSHNMPPITATEDETSTIYELNESRVGRTGQFSCYYGTIDRNAVPRWSSKADDVGDLISIIPSPIETMIKDLYVHRDFADLIKPEVIVYAIASERLADTLSPQPRDRLPIAETLSPLGSGPPIAATPLIPRYDDIIRFVFDRVGWNPSDFVGMRLQLKYPPMPSTVRIRITLPERPQ